ncbi:endonuclease/exonuclease/phosphatase family protein [Pseudomonas sp. LRF_L74]|uniref:endonuclease/exonuclease/phosphatase family protein n=1 Tax=Pseudomonas sp. LRF_L74 TaxID=3369422 RepID=UPI003F5E9709
MTLPKLIRTLLLALAIVLIIAAAMIYSMTWHPATREHALVSCEADAPQPQPGQALKVMTWNVQYLAGKRYVFWYDLADGNGPDLRPTSADLAYNLDEVARVIRDEQPDIVLLQELQDGAHASHYQNQLQLLKQRLSDLYPCSSEAFYWRASFVPYPKIWGSVGTKLATLSRFRIERAERLQLPRASNNWLARPFAPRHSLLVSYLSLRNGRELAVINTRFADPLPQSNAALRQVAMTRGLLDQLENQDTPWLLGGDLNLLPPGQYHRLAEPQRLRFQPRSELAPLLVYPVIPTSEEADQSRWFTRFPNDPAVRGPDRTVDYLLYSPALSRLDGYVRRRDTREISDHLPLVGRLLLPVE